MKQLLTLILSLFITNIALSQKAELHVKNNSARQLTVKIVKEGMESNDSKYSTLILNSGTAATEYFSHTGSFYLKTKAVLKGKPTIYKKGNPFEVYVGRDGYTVLTITFSITESAINNPMEGEEITKEEYELDK